MKHIKKWMSRCDVTNEQNVIKNYLMRECMREINFICFTVIHKFNLVVYRQAFNTAIA